MPEASRLRAVCEAVFEVSRNLVLIERYLEGREFCVAVAGRVVSRGRRLERLPKAFAFSAIERRLDPDEKIFTSMDVKPISGKRAFALDAREEPDLVAELHRLGRAVHDLMGLESVVRIDLRMDARGALHILEANPKPDLKAPTPDVTSLICLGLPEERMDFDDLILGLLADRIDTLFAQERGSASALRALL